MSEREQLRRIIHQWNENRLDLFSLTEPNEELEFHGVMRYYFHESGQRVATKCIRVSSTATTRAVIDALVEKFHPDLRMLTNPDYSLWEVHENGEERILQPDEKPLLVQLNWHKDDREGRFLLKREGDEFLPLEQLNAQPSSMKRKLSRREKKELKKKGKDQKSLKLRAAEAEDVSSKLYSELPQTSFTRTISNPEIVMKKRRERKLELKLREMDSDQSNFGGSLKIYGESLHPDKPYVTLLISVRDPASKIVKETLEKYKLDWHDPAQYCLVEVRQAKNDSNDNVVDETERILADDQCPALILARLEPKIQAGVTFHVRKRLENYAQIRKRPRPNTTAQESALLPQLEVLNDDGSRVVEPRVHFIKPSVTDVGSDRDLAGGRGLMIGGASIQPKHCVVAYMDGVVTITPCSPACLVYIDGDLIRETTILQHGAVVQIGKSKLFQFHEPDTPANVQRQRPVSESGNSSLNSQMPYQQQTPQRIYGRIKRPSVSSTVTAIETTFDVDGHIETVAHSMVSIVPPRSPETQQQRPHSRASLQHRSRCNSDIKPDQLQHMIGPRDVIPAIIELTDKSDVDFLANVIRDVEPQKQPFKLAPVYLIYMASRYRISPHFQTVITPRERSRLLSGFLEKIVDMMHVTIQDHCHDANALAFWLANSSELLFFMKQDVDLVQATDPEPQDSLAEAIQKAFNHLAVCLKQDIHHALPPMLDGHLSEETAAEQCLNMLSNTISLLRLCRMNAALLIQLFSQLFHFMNVYLFNWLLSREGGAYCTSLWGQRLSHRLGLIQSWAEAQGLELASECHLAKILQATALLKSSKMSADDIGNLSSTCYKLNSLQLRCLLQRFKPAPNEQPVTRDFIEAVIKIAENSVDEQLRNDGQPVQLEEETDLQLPFLLPEDGYSPEFGQGLPQGLQEVIDYLSRKGVCRMILQPSSSGLWTVHFKQKMEDSDR